MPPKSSASSAPKTPDAASSAPQNPKAATSAKSTPKAKSKPGFRSVVCGGAPQERVVITDSFLATDAEKHATSKSLYGDSAARISSNVYAIHDEVRHRAYQAIFRSIKGKRLLHLGCGMGLYSMLAARAGAKLVVALDTSAVVNPARVVAEQNGLHNVHFIRGRLRDVLHTLPEKQFEVVLCEWMGTFLLNEDILSDVLYARDHLLTADGVICPNKATLHAVGVSDYRFRLDTEDFWSNVYGFQMEPMKRLVRTEVETCSVPAESILTAPALVYAAEVEKLPALTADDKKGYDDSPAEDGKEGTGEAVSENPVEVKWVPSSIAQKGIDADFTLTAASKGNVNYITFYVDASFTSRVDTGANFIFGIRPGGRNAWTEVSVGLEEALPVQAGEKITGHISAFTPAEKGGRVTVVRVSAKTEGLVAPVSTSGEYYYQSY